MLTRRTLLRSALLLPAAFTVAARAQEARPGTAPAQAKPATDALFPGQIGGFVGRGFLCSLHPKKGNAATGEATSREFTIDR